MQRLWWTQGTGRESGSVTSQLMCLRSKNSSSDFWQEKVRSYCISHHLRSYLLLWCPNTLHEKIKTLGNSIYCASETLIPRFLWFESVKKFSFHKTLLFLMILFQINILQLQNRDAKPEKPHRKFIQIYFPIFSEK